MSKYGVVKNNKVESIFYSELLPSDFPDIESFLMEIPSDVESNYIYNPDDQTFSAPTQIIKDVSPRQIRTALILSGVTLESITAALDSLSEPTKSIAKIEWEFSVAFQRNRPLVTEVGTMLGWTSDQLDALWRLAATL